MSKPIYVSASQIDNFRSCNRRWWFKSIKKIAEPSTAAQIMGTRFAKAVECRLKNEQIPKFDLITDLTIDKFLAAAETYFPAEPSHDIYAERKIDFLFPDMPARMIGYIDVLDLTTSVARIRDSRRAATSDTHRRTRS